MVKSKGAKSFRTKYEKDVLVSLAGSIVSVHGSVNRQTKRPFSNLISPHIGVRLCRKETAMFPRGSALAECLIFPDLIW
jgi:hypothetical protein